MSWELGTPRAIRALIAGLIGLVAALVVYLAILLVGPFDFPWQRVTATMRLEPPVVEERSVRFTGATDLPDGALIDYHYWRDDAINEGPGGVVEVKDGRSPSKTTSPACDQGPGASSCRSAPRGVRSNRNT